jgi:hypothetical protein
MKETEARPNDASEPQKGHRTQINYLPRRVAVKSIENGWKVGANDERENATIVQP